MTTPGPVLGPCLAWIEGSDVAACCSAGVGTDVSVLDTVAFEASMALYEISGRLWTGGCETTVRPVRGRNCSCWGPSGSSWTWSAGYWMDECGDRLGCQPLSRIKLSGYPVREITEVKINGEILDPLDDDGYPNYRLDGYRWLTRMDSPLSGKRVWPGCQNLALNDTEEGTFSVTYSFGVDPPQIARDAAAQLACQLYLSCPGNDPSGECALPGGITRIERQGITIDRELLTNLLGLGKGSSTGIVALDLFLRTYWPLQSGRRPAVYSPDMQGYARRL